MTDSNEAFDIALDRLLAGEATPAERSLVEQRAATDPAVARLVASLDAQFSPATTVWDTDSAWTRLHARVHAESANRDDLPRDIFSAKSKRSWLANSTLRSTTFRIAAAVLVVFGASALWRTASERLHPTAPMREIATTKGQRATFQLADGSRVMLDVDSRMRVDVSRKDGSRDVYLTGEAFFQVKHDAARPFNVHAAGAVTRVLGTEFDVRAYPGGRVFVAVRSGAVSLRQDKEGAAGVLLTRGQIGSIDSLGSAVVHAGANAETYLGWTTGNLVLADVTVREAAEQLARWYDARIVVDDEMLGARKVNATFRDEPVTQALEALSLSLGARVTQVGNTFHISAGRGDQ